MLGRVDVAEKLMILVRQFAPGLPGVDPLARTRPLADAGLSSMGTVRLMLAIEATFGIAIPDAELTPENFATVDAIESLIAQARVN